MNKENTIKVPRFWAAILFAIIFISELDCFEHLSGMKTLLMPHKLFPIFEIIAVLSVLVVTVALFAKKKNDLLLPIGLAATLVSKIFVMFTKYNASFLFGIAGEGYDVYPAIIPYALSIIAIGIITAFVWFKLLGIAEKYQQIFKKLWFVPAVLAIVTVWICYKELHYNSFSEIYTTLAFLSLGFCLAYPERLINLPNINIVGLIDIFKGSYKNIGAKIKALAVFSGIIVGTIGFVVCAIIEIALGFELCGLVIASGFGGMIVLYISSWVLYAFGQMVDDIHKSTERQISAPEEDMPEI